jgi:hypothetical protein
MCSCSATRKVLFHLLWQFCTCTLDFSLAHSSFTPSEKLKPCILDLSPIEDSLPLLPSKLTGKPQLGLPRFCLRFSLARVGVMRPSTFLGGKLALRGPQARESNRTVAPHDAPRIKIRNRKLEIPNKLKDSNPNHEPENH